MRGPLEAPTGGRDRCSVADFTDEDVRRAAAWLWLVGASWKGEAAHYRDCSTSGGGDLPLTPDGLARRLDDIAKRDRRQGSLFSL